MGFRSAYASYILTAALAAVSPLSVNAEDALQVKLTEISKNRHPRLDQLLGMVDKIITTVPRRMPSTLLSVECIMGTPAHTLVVSSNYSAITKNMPIVSQHSKIKVQVALSLPMS